MLKRLLRIFNIIYCAIAVGAICCFAFMPFIKTTISYNVTTETFKKLIGESLPYEFTDEDYADVIGDGLTVKIDVNLKTADLIGVVTKDTGNQLVDNFVSRNVEQIVADLKPALEELARKVACKEAKEPVKEGVTECVKEILGSDEKAQEVMRKAGIDDTYIETMSDNLALAIFPKPDPETGETPVATMDTIKVALVDTMDAMLADLAKVDENFRDEDGNPITVDPEDAERIKNDVQKSLEELGVVNEDGTIKDVSTVLALLLSEEDSPLKFAQGAKLNAGTQEEGPDLAQVLTEKLNGLITQDVRNSVVVVLKICTAILGLMIGGWIVFLVITLIKTFTNKPWTHTWVIFWINFIIQLILGGLLTGGVYLLNGPLHATALGWLPENLAMLTELSIPNFITSAFIPCILSLVLIISMFFYRHFKHKYRRELAQKEIEGK